MSRIPIILNAIGYLTHTITFKLPVRGDYQLFIQVQCNVNKMFASKKKNEVKNTHYLKKEKDIPKKENIPIEIIQDKISIFNDIDQLLINK